MNEIDFRPEDPAVLADPFPLLKRMRDEDPCHWSPRLKSWVLTRYEDVKRVCLDPEHMSSDRLRPFFSSIPSEEAGKIADIMRYLSLWMVFKDPPEHTRLRRLTSKVFHNRSMQAMRPQITEIADWLIARIGDKTKFDFMDEFAGPLPCLVIMAMLGVPRVDLASVKRMSDEIALFIGSSRTSPEKYDTAQAATREMAEYFRHHIVNRRHAPQSDLITELVQLQDGDDRLSEDELVATCILLLFAGHETTTNHIGNGLLSLMRFPEQMDKLRRDPGLAVKAVEELLRFDGPSASQVRVVSQTHAIHGKTLRDGDPVFIMLHSANRDSRVYVDPDHLELDRDGVPHLTFGFGTHICLGFPLARLEGQIAFPALLSAFGVIRQQDVVPEWINSLVFRGMKTLFVEVRRA